MRALSPHVTLFPSNSSALRFAVVSCQTHLFSRQHVGKSIQVEELAGLLPNTSLADFSGVSLAAGRPLRAADVRACLGALPAPAGTDRCAPVRADVARGVAPL